MRNSRLVVLANKTGKKLAEKICEDMGLDQDLINIQRFNDTEILPELKESVRDADVFYICPFYPDPKGRLVETMFVADALRCAVPERKIAIPTYLGFMRSDKPEGRTSINIRKVAETFENDGWDYVASIHIHNKAIYSAFRIPFDSFLPTKFFRKYIDELVKESNDKKEDFVIVAPDLGRAGYAEKFADEVGIGNFAIIYKVRPSPGEAMAKYLLGDVKDKNAVIVDDILDTGGTVIEAARLCEEKGANSIYVVMTHGIFSKKIRKANEKEEPVETIYIESFEKDKEDLKEDLQRILQYNGFEPRTYRIIAEDTREERFYTLEPAEYRLRNSPIERVIVTDTIPRSEWYLEENKDWLTQVSIVPLLEEIIDRVHYKKSLAPLHKQ